MNSHKRRSSLAGAPALVAMASLALVGCGGSDDTDSSAQSSETGGTGGAATGGGGAATGGGGAATGGGGAATGGTGGVTLGADEVRFAGEIVDVASFFAVEGVEVCVLDAEPAVCATTDAAGLFELPVPASAQVAITAEFSGFTPTIYQFETKLDDLELYGLAISDHATSEALLGAVGQTMDPTKGLFALPIDTAGVSMALDPESGEEPWYLVGASISVGDGASPAPGSVMGIINVDPGDVTITLSHATATCESINGWTTDHEPGSETVVIRAGYHTGLFRHECW